ncbi:hypothetical protein [Glycomyces harbinensis]|uniref:Uncharacterized protein n=1 Tax=Glycomyces harbinensis TaxID=58114 RepID=A0A1G6Y3V1_9ACTN|nr:hypothetical protein [Glycomyces harbinensis]SDD84982.1 hypothetical protein SAMN05216270_108116 [Glycomyces harbinensis]
MSDPPYRLPDDDLLDGPLEARSDEVHLRIESHLRDRCGVDTRAVRDCFVWNGLQSEIEVDGFFDVGDAFLERAGAEFERQAARAPLGPDRAMLCLWVHHSTVRAWNHTYRVDLLTRCMIQFRDTVRKCWSLDEEPDPAVELALRLCDLVREEVLLEDRLKTGSRLRYCEALDAVIDSCSAVLEEAQASASAIAAYVRDEVTVRLQYHLQLREANQALIAKSAGQRRRYELRKDLRRLVNSWPFSSVELSKLNAHRQALERLQEAQEERQAWMRVDEGRIVYLFPFGVTGIDYETITSRIRGAGERPEGVVRPTAVIDHFTYHADIWEPRLEREKRFDGLEVLLPKVRLHVDEETVEELSAAIRFSPMGVHCLRLERTVEDLYPSELHAAMFRAAREHGTIEVACDGADRTWDRLSRFARDLVQKQLHAQLAGGDGEDDDPVTIQRGRSHVLVRVLRASERRREFEPHLAGSDPPMVQDGRRLLTLVGASVLLHAAPDAKESLWDWVRLSDDHSRQIWNQRNQGDLLISTENTTVIAALDAPNFISGDLEAVAEFTACLSGTLASWNHQLDRYRASVIGFIAAYNLPGADRSAQLEAMKAARTRMLGFESETRQVISLLHSPNLLRSPSNAAALRRLLAVSGVDEQLETFESRLGEVMADQSEATLQRWEGDRQQRVRDSATAAVSALSICAAISIWQAAKVWTPLGWSVTTAVVALWAVAYVSHRWVTYNGLVSTLKYAVRVPLTLVRWVWTGAAARRMRPIARP